MIAPDSIYLLVDGETDGPHSTAEVLHMLDGGEIAAETLACVAGMPGWRAVRETLVWAFLGVFAHSKDDLLPIVTALATGKTNLPSARLAAKDALQRKVGIIMTLETGILNAFLNTNACLYREYENHRGGFVSEAFPALELRFLGKLDFPRDWATAWIEAGGQLVNGRMVARHADPVWLKLSDFGYPFAPFSFDQSPCTQEVSFTEAEQLGLLVGDDSSAVVLINRPFSLFLGRD